MTRFWITLQQSVEFVVRCIGLMHGGEVFVPRIPSLGIMDLAKAIGPDCDLEFLGIRPGEKLHEVLLSLDEARHAVGLEDMFVILPEFQWWGGDNWSKGEGLEQGFCYSSETNSDWLSAEELRKMLDV